ncbi:WD40 repeat-like protein [Fomitiporia mediterranea MF3/22]|uniref:WD40 repeat-like protein n=1 Tax=Fomitiporia mediterranea (strain MF3/22) TaxID=694068 RepID=UPI000440877A|nr:WD40 repeat-like protein [Fomitiporia mediterranea MF3/22]EJD01319.1 WD40 repeat-like protein [Fomitiporia mediterranea MF3/22]
MANRASKGNKPEDVDEFVEPARYPSPPPHITHISRGVHTPSFSSFQPRDLRFTSIHPVTHVAWSCDGRRLASVGIDKAVRIWTPEKSLESRSAVQYVGGHDYDVDYVTWNPTHPELFCTSSQRDRKIVFWDARQSRPVQVITPSSSYAPSQINYAPDGKTICFVLTNNQLSFMTHGHAAGEAKPQWSVIKSEPLSASTALFNHAGNGLVLSHFRQNTVMIVDYPSLQIREQPAAHVGGCLAVALDPRGRYLASGGNDSIIDIFDMTEWICVNTITCCDHSITSLSFSHDGEYLAVASQGSYIDVCAVETGLPLHRIQSIGPASAVTWHPSKHVLAYCGQQVREGAPQIAYLSLFGPGV